MASLNHDQKVFIVKGFAAFQSPTEVADSVNEEYKLKVNRQQAWKYHPDNPQTAKKWKDMFKVLRKQFIEDTSEQAIAHKAFRLAELEDMRRRAKRARNFPLAAQLLEQAAKEQGGLYTNRRELSGPKGGPIQTTEVTLEQWQANAAQRRKQAAQAITLGGGEDG